MKKFLNFEMVIEPRNGGHHTRVVASPAGYEPLAGWVMRRLGKDCFVLMEEASKTEEVIKTFEDAAADVTPTICNLLARPGWTDDPPDEVSIEFGVPLSAQVGAFTASATAEANFWLSMIWQRRCGAARG